MLQLLFPPTPLLSWHPRWLEKVMYGKPPNRRVEICLVGVGTKTSNKEVLSATPILTFYHNW